MIIEIENKNGRWLINGNKYEDCNFIEKNTFLIFIQEWKTKGNN